VNRPSSNGRLCCASSTGSTRPTSSSRGTVPPLRSPHFTDKFL
jgi:hypothetical protein